MAKNPAKVSVVKHPTIPDVSHVVPAGQVGEWLEQGWVADKPPEETPPATE